MKIMKGVLFLTAGAWMLQAPICWARGNNPDISDTQKLLQDDQANIQSAQQKYREAVLNHGAASEEAREAMNKLDAARNQAQVHERRVQQLQNIDASNAGR